MGGFQRGVAPFGARYFFEEPFFQNMQLKFFMVPAADPQQQIEQDLNAFLRSHRVLAVRQELVTNHSAPFWAISVEYLDSVTSSSSRSASERIDSLAGESDPPGREGTVGLIRSLLSQDATGLPSGVFTFFSRVGWEASGDATGLPSGVSRFESCQDAATPKREPPPGKPVASRVTNPRLAREKNVNLHRASRWHH